MADYIYLLENRLSPAQQNAIGALRSIAREHEATIFLTGGAVRDLTAGPSVRDLDLTVQGDLDRMRKSLEPAGFELVGENREARLLFLTYAGGVRLELGSAVSVTWPKPGKPKYEVGSLIDDLRSRDFTANAMAISLNEGSYGLLMDPLNGVADIENRELRLVSNYGFIEDPSRLIRAVRFMARLGWQMEEKTRGRYDTAKEEGYISNLNAWNRGYELEEIFHEEDPVRILRALENEGWMQHLFPALSSTKSNTAALSDLFNRQGELQLQGILSQVAAIAFSLVTGKMSPADVSTLKALLPRQGFVREIDSLDTRVKDFATRLSGKDVAAPSAAWKLLHSSEPNLVLATSYSSKSAPVQLRLKTFLTESPNARQRIPYQLLTEMRITPDLPEYNALLDTLFFELMDNHLSAPEEMKAFLEPYSPPAPPPPPNLRRARARKEAKPGRGKKKAVVEDPLDESTDVSVAAQEEAAGIDSGLTEVGDLTGPDRGTEPTTEKPIASVAPEAEKPVPAKKPAKSSVEVTQSEPAKKSAVKKADAPKVNKAPTAKLTPVAVKTAKANTPPVKATAKSTAKPAAPVKAAPPAKKVAAKPAPVKVAKKVVAAKVPAKKAVPVKKAVAKAAPTKATKAPAKKAAALTKKAAPAKKAPAKATKAVSTKKSAPAKKTPAKAAKKAPAKKTGRR